MYVSKLSETSVRTTQEITEIISGAYKRPQFYFSFIYLFIIYLFIFIQCMFVDPQKTDVPFCLQTVNFI